MYRQTHDDSAQEAIEQQRALIELFAERLNRLLDSHDYPKVAQHRYAKLAEEFGNSVSGARKWCMGLAIPSPNTLTKIAQRLTTSTDYLLGLVDKSEANSKALGPVVECPRFILESESVVNGEVAGGRFRRISSAYFGVDEQANDGKKICLVECWTDLENPRMRKGEALFVDVNETRLIDNEIYLLRTQNVVCIRRLKAHLNGEIELLVEYADRNNSAVFTRSDIHFNASCSINEAAAASGVKIVGRVVGKIVKYDLRISGLM